MNRRKKVTTQCCECKNASCFVKQCSPEYIGLISEKKNQIRINKGQFIFREDSPVFGIYFIQQGRVKVVSSNIDGKEQIVRFAGDGHILGHRGYGGETHPVGAVAQNDVWVCFLDNALLYDAFKANFEFLYAIMMFYSKELRKSEQRAKYFVQMTVEERVIFALLYISESFGLEQQAGLPLITLSRQDIADIAATNADQVSRVLTFLKNREQVSMVGKNISLADLEGLKKSIARYTTSYS